MKIGVFGDSFADKNATRSWWNFLSDYGHQVRSFGECGSSLSFSAGLLWTHANEFDFVIWCVTSVNRVSYYHHNQSYHVTNAFDDRLDNKEQQRLQNIARSYLSEVFDFHGQEVLANLAITGVLTKLDRILIVPCFATPFYFMQSPGFNLFQLSTREAKFYFPNQELVSIFERYQDRRQCHLTEESNLLLADKISRCIDHRKKVLDAEYDDFPVPHTPLEHSFILK